ncbi:hypothetical protein ACWD4V_00835 [Streptomyces tsukubensis]
MSFNTLMELVREHSLATLLITAVAVIVGPPLLKSVHRKVVDYWSPKITRIRSQIAQRVAPKGSVQPVGIREVEEKAQHREKV